MFQEERYSTPADMWSLGAVMSFYCNKEHLFTSFPSIVKWKGGKSSLDSGKYSLDLRQLVADLLSPDPKNRPTAKNVHEETYKNNRQRHGE